MLTKFEPGVREKLKHYVYRLVDPRDGLTFYVGKGQGDRIFDHVRDARNPSGDPSLRRDLIQEIQRNNLEPILIVQRHGIETDEEARLVEAAVMTCFNGLANLIGPKGADQGPATAGQLNAYYAAGTAEIIGPTVRVTINGRSLASKNGDIYEAARAAWKVGKDRVRSLNAVRHHVLVMMDGVCQAVFEVEPDGWTPWPENDRRYEFTGTEAANNIKEHYIGRVFKTYPFPVHYCGSW